MEVDEPEVLKVDEPEAAKENPTAESSADVILQLVSRIFRVRVTSSSTLTSDDALHLPELSHSLSQPAHQPCFTSPNDLVCQVLVEALLIISAKALEASQQTAAAASAPRKYERYYI